MQKNISLFKTLAVCIVWLCLLSIAYAEPLKVGQTAPDFQLTAQDGSEVNLASRKGVGWTVLYFYPKAGTPGCTAQACAFRDAIQAIRKQNAEVYGISTDEIKALQAFHQQHKLSFTLLSDPEAKVTSAYGVKMPVLTMAKRWTFILDPDLVIRQIDDDVDPALDAVKVSVRLKQLQTNVP
jgi:peroxiredoxin Q/BCP